MTSETNKGDSSVTQPVIDTSIPYGEADVSREVGIEISTSSTVEIPIIAPSTNSLIWKEAFKLLSMPLSDTKKRTLIGKWQKRMPTELAKKELLALVRSAVTAGTLDPVSYIEAELRKYPVPPDPRKFSQTDWSRNVQAAINLKQWAPQWGPAPGKRGCLVPSALVSPQLQTALSQGVKQ